MCKGRAVGAFSVIVKSSRGFVASSTTHLLPRGAMLAGVQGPHGLVGEVDVPQPLPELVREVFARVLAEEAPHLDTDETEV